MLGLRFKIRGKFDVTQARHEVRTTRMKATTRGRVDETRRLTGRHFLERFGVTREVKSKGSGTGQRIHMARNSSPNFAGLPGSGTIRILTILD